MIAGLDYSREPPLYLRVVLIVEEAVGEDEASISCKRIFTRVPAQVGSAQAGE